MGSKKARKAVEEADGGEAEPSNAEKDTEMRREKRKKKKKKKKKKKEREAGAMEEEASEVKTTGGKEGRKERGGAGGEEEPRVVEEDRAKKVDEGKKPKKKKKRKREGDEATSNNAGKEKEEGRSSEGPRQRKKLGAWFPTAEVIKAATLSNSDKCSIMLFYQYATPQWEKSKKDSLVELIMNFGRSNTLGGRVRVACEGVNATVSGSGQSVRALVEELKRFDPGLFGTTDFKYIDDLPPDRAFKDLKVLPVQELVFYGVGEQQAPLKEGGVHLQPPDFHRKLSQPNTVVIDIRNHYEADIGRFDGQVKAGGAQYLDPKMRKSTDFPAWLAMEETKKELEGKEVLMYCTGGVRCERASALLKSRCGESIKGIYQLQGGIERYLQEFSGDGGYWRGKNFVFDKREAIGIGNPAGDGGVVRKQAKKDKAKEQRLGQCCVCDGPWDRYIGKKKCYTCGVPVLMCDKCLTKRPDKTPGQELTVRCPLCKEEGITRPAVEADFTNNGVGVAEMGEGGSKVKGRSAKSVLKWGGGHAGAKKARRAQRREQERASRAALLSG